MLDGEPPSPLSEPAPRALLDAARGEFREGLGALRNLAQLLQSVKTGPKALASLLPDVHAACRTLQHATTVLLEAFGVHLPPKSDAVRALREYVEPRVSELEAELGRSVGRSVNARIRLALEHTVVRICRDLEESRELMAGLEQAIWGPRVRVDLLELARETADAAPARSVPAPVRATLSCPRGIEVVVNPRVVMTLLGIGVELALQAGGPKTVPHVRIDRTDAGQAFAEVTSNGGMGDMVELVARRVLPPTLPCARAMAELNDAELACSGDGARFELLWPRS